MANEERNLALEGFTEASRDDAAASAAVSPAPAAGDRAHQAFPDLTPEQIERLRPLGTLLHGSAGCAGSRVR